jgi:hypothetical protein
MNINTNISSLLTKAKSTPLTQEQQVAEQSRKWVAQTFYGTLLKQLRNSPFKSDVLSGGRGAQAFGPMVDQNMVDRLSRSTGKKLIESLTKSMMKKAAKKAAKQQEQQGGTNVSTIA